MKCSRCQRENQPDAAFCDECGARLDAACPSCGEPNRAGAKFCRKCGQGLAQPADANRDPAPKFAAPESYTPRHLAEKILTSRGALEGERKQVTVLFADLKGSMELLSDRDPEDARKILDPVLERMMDAVHRYEGTVNQVMGDGLMALFGAPLAHEDHAVRACYAALAMQDAVKRYAVEARRTHGINVQIRVGLNSGGVVVRAIGSDLHLDYTAVGQTTHLAARMEQIADPGAIAITADTLALAEGYVEVKSLGPVPVKGLTDAVEVYEVAGAGQARTRLQAVARRGLSRFVGRDAELEHLRRALELAGDGHGQMVALVGEAGVGKSRLLYEFTHSHCPQSWLILESSSVSYGKVTSYLPVIDLLRGYFKIQDGDGPSEIREKVIGKLSILDQALKPTLPALLALLDVPVDEPGWQTLEHDERRRRTLEAVKRLLLRAARERPLLLIVEDLHRIDPETEALLSALVEGLAAVRLLLLVNYRPEYQHSWGSKTSYSQVRLDALSAARAGELLDAILGEDAELEPLKELLVRRGNLFFLEETVRTLVETKVLAGSRGRYRLTQPIQSIRVPSSVQAMLAARIDRLPPEDKRLLQVASVVGKDVPFGLLDAVADLPAEALRGGLSRLQAAEFLYETGLYPELEYSFKHALTHEVAYGGLLQERRRMLHARIVDAIEGLHRDRLGGEIERLAHHAVRGELREKAVGYLRQAGRRAAARSAPRDARAWFEQALALLEALPASRDTLEQAFEIRLELRPVMQQLGEARRMLERLREAEDLADRLNDDRRRGRVCALATNDHSRLGELDEALETGRRALAIARRLEDARLGILTTSFLGQAHYYRGEYEEAVALATENLAALPAESVYDRFDNSSPASVYDRACLVRSLAELGRFAEAVPYEAEAIRIAETTQHPFTIAAARWAACTLYLLKGDWSKALSVVEEEIELVRSENVVFLLPFAVANSAWVLAQLGRMGEALRRLQEGSRLVEDMGMSGGVAHRTWVYHALGRASLLLGRVDEAQRLADRAVESSPSQRGFAAHALHLLGDIASHPDGLDPASAETHYRDALALAEPRHMRPLVAHCHLGLGRLYGRTGERRRAETHLATATAMYREMEMRWWAEQAESMAMPGAARHLRDDRTHQDTEPNEEEGPR